MAEMAGGVFAALTVNRKLLLARAAPSLTARVMSAVPNWLVAGRTFTVRLEPLPPKMMFATGTREGFDELPVTTRVPGASSTSPTVKGMSPVAVFSAVTWPAITEITGGSLTGLTVTVKTRLTVALVTWPSPTVTVILALPFAFGNGAKSNEPFAAGEVYVTAG